MKKSKIFVVIALAVVLCVVSVTSTTFSWFTRPRADEGDRLLFPGKTYDVSTGSDVTFATYESTDGGETYGTTPVTDFNCTSLATKTRKMYRTDITNSGAQAQSVSLYLNNLNIPEADNGYFYLGVNSPLKTYKIYGKDMSDGYQKLEANKIDNPANTLRLYFCPTPDGWTGPDVNWKDKNLEVVYGLSDDPTTSHYDALQAISNNHLYFKDIPANVSWFYFHVQLSDQSYQRTPTLYPNSSGLSKTSSKMFQLTGTYDNPGYNNAQVNAVAFTGANIARYYNTITIPVGTTFDVSLINGTDYIGNIAYYADDSGTYTLNSGKITAVKTGTGVLYTKTTSQSTDAMQVNTVIKVVDKVPEGSASIAMAPVVTNVRVGGSTEDGPTTESVYWYIKNNSSSAALNYTVASLDLTL